MRIAVVGTGGLGGYFGARLAAAGADVAFLARGAHLAAMRTNGLRLESPKGNLHLERVLATDDPSAIGPVDFVLFAVKRYDTAQAAMLLPPLIGPNTVVISFQNGIDAANAMIDAVGRSHVAAGIAYITALIAEPGVIRHTILDRLIFGEIDGGPSPRLEPLRALGERAGITPTLSEQIDVAIWS
jgi:2-dehydropantoate 2-reductase